MCFGQTTLKIRVIYTLSSNKKPLEHQCIGAPKQHRKARPHGAEEAVRADPLSIPKSSACSRYAYRREAEQPPPTANHREQTIIRSTRSRQRNLKLSGWET